MTDDELINRDYPLNETANMRDIQESEQPALKPRHKSSNKIPTITRNDADATTQQQDGYHDNMEPGKPAPRRQDVEQRSRARNVEADASPENQQAPKGEHVIDKIVDHGRCDDEDNPSTCIGDLLYRVRWYGFTSKDDTWEPVRHLPRNKIVSYHRRTQQPLPHEDELNQARAG